MEAYSNPEKVISTAKDYFTEGEKLLTEELYTEAIEKFEFSLRSIRKLNTSDINTSQHISDQQKRDHEYKCYLQIAKTNTLRRSLNPLATLKAATQCLNYNPKCPDALVARIKVFLHPSIWQSRNRALCDLEALKEIDPTHPFIQEFSNRKLPPIESDTNFGRQKNLFVSPTSNEPEVLEAYENQKKFYEEMIKSFSSN